MMNSLTMQQSSSPFRQSSNICPICPRRPRHPPWQRRCHILDFPRRHVWKVGIWRHHHHFREDVVVGVGVVFCVGRCFLHRRIIRDWWWRDYCCCCFLAVVVVHVREEWVRNLLRVHHFFSWYQQGCFFFSFGLRVIYHHHHRIYKSANVMIFIPARIVSCKKKRRRRRRKTHRSRWYFESEPDDPANMVKWKKKESQVNPWSKSNTVHYTRTV